MKVLKHSCLLCQLMAIRPNLRVVGHLASCQVKFGLVYVVYFLEKCTDMRKNNNFFLAAARLFWPEGCFWDFFGLKKAEGLLKAKKIPKTAHSKKRAHTE